MASTENKLIEWARWSLGCDSGTGFKPIWEAIERHAPVQDADCKPRKSVEPLMNDSEASKVDRAVSRMGNRNAVLSRIIKKIYLRKNTIEEIARYYLTPMEYPDQLDLDWDDIDKKKVDVKIAKALLSAAHEVIELELALIEREAFLNRK